MAIHNYNLSHSAETELIEIWNYIANDNPRAADEFIDKLTAAMFMLADMPYMGRMRDELTAGYRSFPVGNYMIFYRIVDEAIEIMHIIHSRRDIEHFTF